MWRNWRTASKLSNFMALEANESLYPEVEESVQFFHFWEPLCRYRCVLIPGGMLGLSGSSRK